MGQKKSRDLRSCRAAKLPPLFTRSDPGLQSHGAKFLTVDTNLRVFVELGEIGLVLIASLSYVWAGYHAKTSVEAARQIKQE